MANENGLRIVALKVTDAQRKVLQELADSKSLTQSEVLRDAVRLYTEQNGGEWPEAEIKHGGWRGGVKRK